VEARHYSIPGCLKNRITIKRAYLCLGRVAEVGNGGADVDLRGLGVVIVEGQVGHEVRVRQDAAQPTKHRARQRHAAVLCTTNKGKMRRWLAEQMGPMNSAWMREVVGCGTDRRGVGRGCARHAARYPA
jgi:hypothetical protein